MDGHLEQNAAAPKGKRLVLSINVWIVTALLAVIIVVMLVLWRPWHASSSARTVSVTGETSLKATPDEFVFSPSYTSLNADKGSAITEVSTKSDQVVAGLKALGVNNNDIASSIDGYEAWDTAAQKDGYNYTASLTVTVHDRALAQKVQNYLVTTTPEGSVTPYADFSTAARKKLEATARTQAIDDARDKAEQTAKQIDATLGKVKSVDDSAGSADIQSSLAQGSAMCTGGNCDATNNGGSNVALQSGQNEFDYSVTVVYYLR